MKLTLKQLNFCHYYLEFGGNATKAYLAAGYRVKSDVEARACASRLLTNDNVKKYLKEQQERLQDLNLVKVEDVIQALAKIAFSGLSNALEIDELGELRLMKNGDLSNVEQIITKEFKNDKVTSRCLSVKSLDCLKALDILCKILGLYSAKTENQEDFKIENVARVLMHLKNKMNKN